jgi:5-methylcytosine-specific restriction protein B
MSGVQKAELEDVAVDEWAPIACVEEIKSGRVQDTEAAPADTLPAQEEVMPSDVLGDLSAAIAQGLPVTAGSMRSAIEKLFGERYQKRHLEPTSIRDAYALATEAGDGGVPYAGLINPDNPTSGPFGGTSVDWFPSEPGSLIALVVGTRGLAPDEGILTRPGHRRRIIALRRHLTRRGIDVWSKPDPSALAVKVPKTVRERFPGFEKVFERYGAEIYVCAPVPREPASARDVVRAFLDLYAYERGWQAMQVVKAEYELFHADLRSQLFEQPTAAEVHELLRARRFVVLQGPPGTGKTRMANEIVRQFFPGRGMTVQFHPAVTYEDFVVGLSPDAQDRGLRFAVREGWLTTAIRRAKDGPFVLVIDEVNRADLGKVLGEAIYLFEAGEVGGDRARHVSLPHSIDGQSELQLPDNLFVLATMNTADRSIASMDLAIRRRFAFVTVPPNRDVITAQGLPLASQVFDWIADVFVEHAPNETLQLLPGHAYFLAENEDELRERFRYELLPLLDEYLQQGYLGPAASELHAVRDRVEDLLGASRGTRAG